MCKNNEIIKFNKAGKLELFGGMSYDEALVYYRDKNNRGKYYNLYLEAVQKSLKNENFSNYQVELFIEAINQGYDYRWLITDNDVTKEHLVDMYNKFKGSILTLESIRNYSIQYINAIKRTLIKGYNVEPYIVLCKKFKTDYYALLLDLLINTYGYGVNIVKINNDKSYIVISDKCYNTTQIPLDIFTYDYVYELLKIYYKSNSIDTVMLYLKSTRTAQQISLCNNLICKLGIGNKFISTMDLTNITDDMCVVLKNEINNERLNNVVSYINSTVSNIRFSAY